MELKQLAYFKAIVEEGTISVAARRLHVTTLLPCLLNFVRKETFFSKKRDCPPDWGNLRNLKFLGLFLMAPEEIFCFSLHNTI